MWDERYATPGHAYGESPNDFLAEQAALLPPGPVVDLAGGEGRNAVFLAQRGHAVTLVDGSAVALKNAEALAASRGCTITTVHTDLAAYELGTEQWAGAVSIWAHTPKTLRARLHRDLVRALRPGGALILEAYTPDQLALKTGGPPDADRYMTLAGLRSELQGLDIIVGRELQREVQEGAYHRGLSAVVQVVARKPA